MDSRALRYTGLQLAVVGLESIWIACMALVLSPARAIGIEVLVATGVLTLFWNRLLMARGWLEQGWGRLVGLAGMALLVVLAGWAAEPDVMGQAVAAASYADRVAVLLGSRTLLIAWLVAILLMGRVVFMLRRQISLERAIGRIRTSAALTLVALGLLHGIGTRLTWLVAGLVGFALVVMPLARAIELARERMAGGMPFTFRWVGTLLLGVGIVLVLGLSADAPLGPQHFGLVYALIGILQQVAVYIFAFILEVLVKGLVPIFQWLANFYLKIFQEVLLPMLAAFMGATEGGAARGQMIDTNILQILAVALVIITIALPIVVVWHFYRLFKIGIQVDKSSAETEEAALAAAWYEWWKAQQDALRRFWSQLRRRRFGVDTVRDLYKNLLLFGDEHQLPRPTANTPYEYLAPLCLRYPALVGEFHALTDAYVAVKYGEHDFTEKEVRGLQRAWERITRYKEENEATTTEQADSRLTPLPSK